MRWRSSSSPSPGPSSSPIDGRGRLNFAPSCGSSPAARRRNEPKKKKTAQSPRLSPCLPVSGLSGHVGLLLRRVPFIRGGLAELRTEHLVYRRLQLLVRNVELGTAPERGNRFEIAVTDEHGTYLVFHLLKGGRPLHALVFHLDHVPAEGGLHRLL